MNSTLLREFYLKTFLVSEQGQIMVFIGVLLMYLLAVCGNLIIFTIVSLVSQLHTPMYLFLRHLAALDIVYVSSILPKLMMMTITQDTSISFSGCLTQLFIYVFCIDTEFLLLTSMAYDRYVAICIPLRYSLIMNKTLCCLLITMSWIGGFLNSFILCMMMSNATFCKEHEINNFFCDAIILLKLSCTDILYIMIFITTESIIIGWFPFILIIISYTCIIFTIIEIRSSSGRLKTFTSCSSHLTVVILFYGTCLGLNFKPKSVYSLEMDKILSMLYIGVPMINPLVYSLRNKDVLSAMKNVLIKIFSKYSNNGDIHL